MLDAKMLDTYKALKSKMTAAYAVFKRSPTHQNIARHSTASQAFTNFCIEAMAELADDKAVDNTDKILQNIEDYKTCKTCGSELLYLTDLKNYIASSEFVPEFPGWCHTCLIEHCLKTPCESCKLVSDPTTCAYKDVKKFYQED